MSSHRLACRDCGADCGYYHQTTKAVTCDDCAVGVTPWRLRAEKAEAESNRLALENVAVAVRLREAEAEIRELRLILQLERAALEESCATPIEGPITEDEARARSANRFLLRRSDELEAEIERLRGVDACYAMAQEEIARMGVEIRRLKKLVSTSLPTEEAK